MNRSVFLLFVSMCYYQGVNAQGRIGINTNSPQAMLHIKDSSVLFSANTTLPQFPGNPPASGAGVRMMWYPQKAAFRAGDAGGLNWDRDSIGNYSFAAGQATKAKGLGSVALGANLSAEGDYSVAIGFNSKATENYSFAFGRQVTASNTGSFATGYGTNALGLASTAMGYFNTATGAYSTAMGFSTETVGQMSVATGYDTETIGIVSFAGGYRSTATGSYSMAMGFQTNSFPFASLAIGRYNVDTADTDDAWVATDPVFIIGNGEDAATRSNAFTVLKNGKTAINGHNPIGGLHIKGFDATENTHILLEDNNSTNTGKIFYTGAGDLFFKNTRVGGDFYFRNDANANALSLFSTGNVTIAGTLTESSDARLKKDFMPLESSLQKIVRLNGYHYRWIDSWRDRSLQTGFTAQEVEAVMPELVVTAEDGIKSVNYSGIIPYLVEAVKELKQQNDELRKEIQRLQHR